MWNPFNWFKKKKYVYIIVHYSYFSPMKYNSKFFSDEKIKTKDPNYWGTFLAEKHLVFIFEE